MRIPIVWTAIFLMPVTAPAFAQPSSTAPADMPIGSNLDFEASATGSLPPNWSGGGTGYTIGVVSTKPHAGRQCARIARAGGGESGDGFASLTQALPVESVRGKRLRYTAWLRSTGIDTGWSGLWMRVDGPDHKVLAFDNMQDRPVKGTTPWTSHAIVLDVPSDATAVYIGALLSGDGRLWIDAAAVEAVRRFVPTTGRQSATSSATPGLFEMRGAYTLTAGRGAFAGVFGGKPTTQPASGIATVLLPVPLSYGPQVPLTYELTAKPGAHVRSARVYEDKPGNWVVKVSIELPADGESMELSWRSLVLCGPRSFDDVPKHAKLPDDWPAEARPWLASTRCAEAADPKIKNIAAEIRGDERDVLTLINATLKRTRDIFQHQKGHCRQLGAVEALERQGSCTSCANLVAALLRASGIPARILAGYPIWSGPLQTHYIVEAYVPGYGWYPIESTRLEAPWPACQQMQVSIIPPEYEDRSAPRFSAAGGVPYLSLTEYPGHDGSFLSAGAIDGKMYCDHVARQVRGFDGESPESWRAALASARKRWAAWLSSKPTAARGRLATPGDSSHVENAESLGAVTERL